MKRIIIVSNRVTEPGKAAQAGGVSVALSDVVARHNGLWVGWDGRIDEGEPSTESAPEATRKRRRWSGSIVTTSLTREEHAGFYLGYSNSVLWPVLHNRLDLAHFEDGFFRTYRAVNARFARILQPVIEPDDLIWVHDYQFITLGLELRALGINNPIGFFLHIPFPPSQCFLAIPEHRDLAKALSAYQLIGLQTRADVANLIEFFEQGVDGRLLNDGRIRVLDRVISVERFPIGINPADFTQPKSSHDMVQGGPSTKRIIGVDRLDYSKGLPQKFRAFGRFLELAPAYTKKVVLTQIAPPTRESVHAYADIRRELQELSGSINGRFGDLDWVPIHYIHRQVPRTRLAEIYRSSRIGLVTPLRDGMNLVAKEFIAAQDPSDPGVLILSQFAGAAEDMKDALIVNPYNVEEIAEAIRTAIEMPLAERIERHAKLFGAIKADNVHAWANAFINALIRTAGAPCDPVETRHAARLEAAIHNLSGSGYSRGRSGGGTSVRKVAPA